MKKNTGITLVALVITIIILLILAGVAISMIGGEKGLFAQANGAATKYNQAAKNEADLINQLLNGNYFGSVDGEEDNPQVPEEPEIPEVPVQEPINNESHVGYYADLNPEDGKIDGIIFADQAVGGSGQWVNKNGTYTIPVKTGLKEYYESQDSYTVEGFGTKPVLSPKTGSTGEDRFYIMTLENFEGTASYTWYSAAYGKMNASDTSEEFGTGRANTAKMIGYWNAEEPYGTQTATDMWGVIQEKVAEGWFVPSRAEWAAFAGTFKITSSNYGNYGLNGKYWSSSQFDKNCAWLAYFDYGYMNDYSVYTGINYSWFVRLATTF